MTSRGSRSPVRGRQLILILMGIALVTVVLPPAGAWRLNRYRVEQTAARASSAARRIARQAGSLAPLASTIEVACGPGRLPKSLGGVQEEAWLRTAVIAPTAFGDGMPTDAWGQCFLMNIGAGARGERVWILSAGPNGLIDTPIGASTLSGDDIGAVVK